jgi:hypothetical protein
MSPIIYIVVALVALLIGWAIGFFDSNMRTADKIKAAEQKAEKAARDAELKLAQARPQPQTQADDPGLLRLKNDNGQLKLEIDGAPVNEALSPERKKRLIEILTMIRPWLEGGQPQQAAPPPPAPVQTAPTPAPVQRAVSRPMPQTSSPLPEQTPAIKAAADAKKNIASLSIVQQIDTVLQERLMGTSLEKKGIRLQESSEGGVEVYVGLSKFNTVDDVPDAEIKASIRAAISEWENKYTPGKK